MAPPPVQRKGAKRRASPKVLVGVAVAALIVAGAAVGIALGLSGTDSTPTVPTRGSLTNALPGAAEAHRLFAGIPQHGNTLGSPSAPVTMVEYIDLQCPHCRDFETLFMPTIVRRFVRTGKLKVVARPVAVIGPDSILGRNAAIAAGEQNKLFNFTQVTYDNQGVENTGWLTDAFVQQAGASVPGMNVPQLTSAARSSQVAARAKVFAAQASADDIPGTPAVFVGRSNGRLRYVADYSAANLSAEIRRALR
jgi:protein-disulfide isomerase